MTVAFFAVLLLVVRVPAAQGICYSRGCNSNMCYGNHAGYPDYAVCKNVECNFFSENSDDDCCPAGTSTIDSIVYNYVSGNTRLGGMYGCRDCSAGYYQSEAATYRSLVEAGDAPSLVMAEDGLAEGELEERSGRGR